MKENVGMTSGDDLVGRSAELLTPAEIAAVARAAAGIMRQWRMPEQRAAKLAGVADLNDLGISERELSHETKSRLVALFSVHSLLRTIFSEPERAHQWISRPNDAFDGRSALDVMEARGLQGIEAVSAYLMGVANGR